MRDSEKGWSKGNIIWHKLIIPDLMTIGFVIMILLISWAYQHDLKAFNEDIQECWDNCQNPLTTTNTGHKEYIEGLNWTINTNTGEG